MYFNFWYKLTSGIPFTVVIVFQFLLADKFTFICLELVIDMKEPLPRERREQHILVVRKKKVFGAGGGGGVSIH